MNSPKSFMSNYPPNHILIVNNTPTSSPISRISSMCNTKKPLFYHRTFYTHRAYLHFGQIHRILWFHWIIDSNYVKLDPTYKWIVSTCISKTLGPMLYGSVVDSYRYLLEDSHQQKQLSRPFSIFHNHCGQ